MQVGDTEAVFESTENHFQKSFSVKSMRLAATENRFSGKSFPFDQNFTLLTRKSFYIVVLPSNDFRKKCKREREPQKEKTHANKTHSARERENDRRRSQSWSPDCADQRRSRSRGKRRSHDRDLTIEIGEIAIVISSISISLIEIAPISIAISPRKCDLFWVLFVFLGMNDIMGPFGLSLLLLKT